MSKVVGLPNNSHKLITNTAWVRARLCKLQKGYTRFATARNLEKAEFFARKKKMFSYQKV
jgi:hypothetical protein